MFIRYARAARRGGYLFLVAAAIFAGWIASAAEAQAVFRIEKGTAPSRNVTSSLKKQPQLPHGARAGAAVTHAAASAAVDSMGKLGGADPPAASYDVRDTLNTQAAAIDTLKTRTPLHDFGAAIAAPQKDTIPSLTRPARALQKRRSFGTAWLLRLVLVITSLALIALTILLLARMRTERQRFMTSTRLSIMDKEVQRACRCIERLYAKPSLSVEEVSRELVTGPAFLQALFARELGMTVEDFIEQVRVNRVKMALQEDPRLEPALCAARAGFGSLESMERAFRKITGMDLGQYASALQGQKTRPA